MNSVSNKIADFTLKTIQALITKRETDALLALGSTINEYENRWLENNTT
jgi:hypothetical protein